MTLRILVCVKIVPDIEMVLPSDWLKVKDFQKAEIGYVNNIMNIFDQSTLELALRLKDTADSTHGSIEVSALFAGDSTGDFFLRNALSLHADRAVRIDCKPRDLNTPDKVASKIFQAVQSLGPFDLIFFGMQASPFDQAQTGLIFAEETGWPCITHVNEVTMTADEAVIVHQNDVGMEKISVHLPAVLIVGNTNGISLRLPSLKDKLEADDKPIDIVKCPRWKARTGACVRKKRIEFTAICSHRSCEMIQGQGIEQKAQALMDVVSNESNE